MSEFNTLENISAQIKSDLDKSTNKKKIGLLFAFNGTGKTRLSAVVKDEFENKTLAYDAFFEDLFSWDNENFTLRCDPYSKIINYINEQGLENQISDNFQKIVGSKIHPSYDLANGKVTFNFATGDDRSENNIKISRGEESVFIWSIFFTVLESVISALNTEKENRETQEFDNLQYIIIDDPVSSIDDTKIIEMALELIRVLDSSQNNNVRFFITTHHALFYNILFNEFSRKKGYMTIPWLLSNHWSGLKLEKQDDSPFGYHLVIKDKIQEAINTHNLEKYHFNLFRSLLEKSANFLGYSNWSDCLKNDHKKEIMRLVNLYSHGKLSELESKHFPDEHKDLFTRVFNDFISEFKWKV